MPPLHIFGNGRRGNTKKGHKNTIISPNSLPHRFVWGVAFKQIMVFLLRGNKNAQDQNTDNLWPCTICPYRKTGEVCLQLQLPLSIFVTSLVLDLPSQYTAAGWNWQPFLEKVHKNVTKTGGEAGTRYACLPALGGILFATEFGGTFQILDDLLQMLAEGMIRMEGGEEVVLLRRPLLNALNVVFDAFESQNHPIFFGEGF